ncbi:DUF934 domain-containing protein [Thalassobaculum sp.]|uniref:DUF934 domain-containing protein n=1 Tax=Thalassobaculum sp. TaxID=2022740 RepID=UPI0032EBA37E
MPLIKNGAAVQDPWFAATTESDLDRSGPLLVPLELWQQHRDRLVGRVGPLGVRLASAQSPALIAADLDRLDLVALEFPKFTDGRAYSYARLLRERHGFTGEVRAVGHVLRDQIAFMLRCGFDSLEVDERAAGGWQSATTAFSAWYQPATDAQAPIPARRRYAVPARTSQSVIRSEPVRTADAAELAVCAATWAY